LTSLGRALQTLKRVPRAQALDFHKLSNAFHTPERLFLFSPHTHKLEMLSHTMQRAHHATGTLVTVAPGAPRRLPLARSPRQQQRRASTACRFRSDNTAEEDGVEHAHTTSSAVRDAAAAAAAADVTPPAPRDSSSPAERRRLLSQLLQIQSLQSMDLTQSLDDEQLRQQQAQQRRQQQQQQQRQQPMSVYDDPAAAEYDPALLDML
jgi:hypothetical protein